jgi:hypothetical protein
MKLGRRRPAPGHKKLHLRDYLRVSLEAPPATCDYSKPAMTGLSNIFLNDQLGDCVIAAGAHVTAQETGNAGDLFVYSPAQILADYGAIGGYVPGDPSTDNGCDEVTALNYWQTNGFADGTKLAGYLHLNAANEVEVMQALYLFENVLFGVELPDAWINPFPSASGFVWDVGTPNPDNGHAFMGTGYNQTGVQIDTWGFIGTITWPAVSALCSTNDGGQLYVVMTPDQLEKGQTKAPNGLEWVALQSDFDALTS